MIYFLDSVEIKKGLKVVLAFAKRNHDIKSPKIVEGKK